MIVGPTTVRLTGTVTIGLIGSLLATSMVVRFTPGGKSDESNRTLRFIESEGATTPEDGVTDTSSGEGTVIEKDRGNAPVLRMVSDCVSWSGGWRVELNDAGSTPTMGGRLP